MMDNIEDNDYFGIQFPNTIFSIAPLLVVGWITILIYIFLSLIYVMLSAKVKYYK